MQDHIKKHIEKHQQRFIEELTEFLRIPSISADKDFKNEIYKAACFLQEKLQKAGVDYAEIIETIGNPVVYAEKITDSSLPTVLIYGHYDVQPPDPIELWESPPFEPMIRDGKIYARGACDDKGQMYMHIKVLEMLNHFKSFPCNLKFLFEGEEEVGSYSLEKFICEHKKRLEADVCLISDTELIDNDTPGIIYGLKGICYFEVSVKGASRDLHSGMYGGAVPNPLNILCEIIGKLKDENSKILIPGFYDDLIHPSMEERAMLNLLPFDNAKFRDETGIVSEYGERGFSISERIALRPTLDVNGMSGGYIGVGAKTVIPKCANAKISMRLVPGQKADKVADSFIQYIKSITPKSVTIDIEILTKSDPVIIPLESDEIQAAKIASKVSFGKEPLLVRIGGTIPVVSMVERLLGIKSVLMGFGLSSDNIHAPNEHFGIYNYLKGIETIPQFFEHYSVGINCDKV